MTAGVRRATGLAVLRVRGVHQRQGPWSPA
jgi:hypothetical protein